MQGINKFEKMVDGGGVRKNEPDPGKARGLIEMAMSDMERVNMEKINEDSASYVFKNAYDVIRYSISALMALDGFHPYSHVAVVAYMRDELTISDSLASKFNKFRKLRNNIEYRAERATVKEAEEILNFMKDFVPKMKQKVESRIL